MLEQNKQIETEYKENEKTIKFLFLKEMNYKEILKIYQLMEQIKIKIIQLKINI